MRKPKYLSPSALGCWEKDPEEYYLRYLATEKPPRFDQTEPMAVGSAFDAYVKAYLGENLGVEGLEFEQLFASQVDAPLRDKARVWGKTAFDNYKNCGALADLMMELGGDGCTEHGFEFSARGEVGSDVVFPEEYAHLAGSLGAEITDTAGRGVVLLGKPDCYFRLPSGKAVILDWKVNGFLAKRATSPKRGYLTCRNYKNGTWQPGVMHKQCQPMRTESVMVNVGEFLEDIDKTWGTQLCVYGWLTGEAVGTSFIVGLDQLVGPGAERIASFRHTISAKFQYEVLGRFQTLQNTIDSGWIFRDLTEEKSLARQAELDTSAVGLRSDGSDKDEWFVKTMRKH